MSAAAHGGAQRAVPTLVPVPAGAGVAFLPKAAKGGCPGLANSLAFRFTPGHGRASDADAVADVLQAGLGKHQIGQDQLAGVEGRGDVERVIVADAIQAIHGGGHVLLVVLGPDLGIENIEGINEVPQHQHDALHFVDAVVQLIERHVLGVFQQAQGVAQHVLARDGDKGGVEIVGAAIVDARALVQRVFVLFQQLEALFVGALGRGEHEAARVHGKAVDARLVEELAFAIAGAQFGNLAGIEIQQEFCGVVYAVLAIGAIIQQEAVKDDVVEAPAEGGVQLVAQLMGNGVQQDFAFFIVGELIRIGGHGHGFREGGGVHHGINALQAPDYNQNAHQKAGLHGQGFQHNAHFQHSRNFGQLHGKNPRLRDGDARRSG